MVVTYTLPASLRVAVPVSPAAAERRPRRAAPFTAPPSSPSSPRVRTAALLHSLFSGQGARFTAPERASPSLSARTSKMNFVMPLPSATCSCSCSLCSCGPAHAPLVCGSRTPCPLLSASHHPSQDVKLGTRSQSMTSTDVRPARVLARVERNVPKVELSSWG